MKLAGARAPAKRNRERQRSVRRSLESTAESCDRPSDSSTIVRKSHDYQARDCFLVSFRERDREFFCTVRAADNSRLILRWGTAGVLKSEISHGRILPRGRALLPRISRTRALFRITPQQQCQSGPPSQGNETVTSRHSACPETGRDRHTRCAELVLVRPWLFASLRGFR